MLINQDQNHTSIQTSQKILLAAILAVFLIISGAIFTIRSKVPEKSKDTAKKQVKGVNVKISPTITTSLSPTQNKRQILSPPTPTNTPTPQVNNNQTQSNQPKACFTYSSNSPHDSDIYYYGNDIVLDASCSQNVSDYRWYFDDTSLTKTDKVITNSLSPSNLNDDLTQIKEYTYKLVVFSTSGASNTVTRSIKARLAPDEPHPTASPTIPAQSPTPSPILKSNIKIKILNGTTTPGKASDVKTILQAKNYSEIITGNADSFDYQRTAIEYKSSEIGTMIKNDLSDHVSSPEMVVLDQADTADIVLIVGTNFN